MNKEINEKILLNFGVRTAKRWGGRWVISLPHEIFDSVPEEKIRKAKTKEVDFNVYVTDSGKIVLEVV